MAERDYQDLTYLTYRSGFQDGALATLAPALGVEPADGQPPHMLLGRRFKVTLEWLDPITDEHAEVARTLARRALARMDSA